MNRDEQRTERINQFLDWSSEEELSEDLLKVASSMVKKNPAIAASMVANISLIVKSAVEELKYDNNRKWNAMERAVQLQNFPKKYTANDWVVHNTAIVMELFPDAHCRVPWASGITVEFFEKWLTALKESQYAKGEIDSYWSRQQGYSDYFKKALEENE